MHPEVRQSTPGRCRICGMNLVKKGKKMQASKWRIRDFLPLIVIWKIVTLLVAVMLVRRGGWDTMEAMRYFEGFFFLAFGLFKLLNWKGFADAYATYDIIAKRSRLYAYLYPLIELALAAGYLFSFHLLAVSWATLVLMIIGSIGVFGELRKKKQIPCACLGVVFKIPMTWVTFVEDVVMALMAGAMIVLLS